jgi:hypothetical protein
LVSFPVLPHKPQATPPARALPLGVGALLRFVPVLIFLAMILSTSENVEQTFQFALVPSMDALPGHEQTGKFALHSRSVFMVSRRRQRRHE